MKSLVLVFAVLAANCSFAVDSGHNCDKSKSDIETALREARLKVVDEYEKCRNANGGKLTIVDFAKQFSHHHTQHVVLNILFSYESVLPEHARGKQAYEQYLSKKRNDKANRELLNQKNNPDQNEHSKFKEECNDWKCQAEKAKADEKRKEEHKNFWSKRKEAYYGD